MKILRKHFLALWLNKKMNMKYSVILLIIGACIFINMNCANSNNNQSGQQQAHTSVVTNSATNKNTSTLLKRYNVPANYERTPLNNNDFGNYLRNIPLKPIGAQVHYYNGAIKANANVYDAVVDLNIGNKDLHQCADAVMYMWGNYCYENKKWAALKFKFLGDDKWHDYTTFCNGNYNNKTYFDYIQQVWQAANTRSLHGQLQAVTPGDIKIGDILIVTGNPYGHAITIVDECIHKTTGKKLFMLAQSYMPAQETQILVNAQHPEKGVWYNFNEDDGNIYTPEWHFKNTDARRFVQ
jgi:Domain of unknown function (4846)